MKGSAASLTADYTIANISDAALPFMWALHGRLAGTPEDRIELEGVTGVAATYVARDGHAISAPQLTWPGPDSLLGMPLDHVQPALSRFAAKLYASHVPGARASVGGRNGWLDLSWDNQATAHLGIWLNYGGWPEPGNNHHLALEPTTAPADDLGEALEQGNATILVPGATARWRVGMTLRPPGSH
jgi:hypothetical protein